MKTKIIITLVVLFTTCFLPIMSYAAPILLTDWVVNNSFNFAGGQGAGQWTLQNGDTAVYQSINGDPTMFLNPDPLGDIENLSGTFREIDGDNDFVGFIFGYQNTGSFYLFDWKQGYQQAYGATAYQGISLKRIDSAPTTHGDLWNTNSVLNKTTLLYHKGGIGRSYGVNYTFELDRILSTGEISISLLQGTNVLDSFTLYDTTYGTGQFGFYNYSEARATYSGFTADVFQVVPEPTTMLLLGCGLLGLAGARRRMKR